jgi:glycerol-3-phosphate acyltransferase PlsY
MQFETLSIILLATILSYLLGSIPFGVIVAKFCKVDIQNVGSGNIGATNVLRTLGPVAGGVVFVLDLLKGTLAAVLAIWLLPSPLWIILASSMSIIGHMFPVFLKFKGGRGSATGLGVLLAIAPDVFLGAFILVVIIIGATRYVRFNHGAAAGNYLYVCGPETISLQHRRPAGNAFDHLSAHSKYTAAVGWDGKED